MTAQPAPDPVRPDQAAGTEGSGGLAGLLQRLADLLGPEHPEPGELLRRLTTQRLRVAIVGEAKRGKSTLVNALLGRDVLPMGVTPLTAIPTTVRAGDRDVVRVQLVPGSAGTGTGARPAAPDASEHSLSELAEFVTETGNPGNVRAVREVTVELTTPLAVPGLELVDTPGTGSVYTHNTVQAVASMATMDAAVFVLTSDPPISQAEHDLLVQVAQAAVRVSVVLNKADRLDAQELASVREFTRRALEPILGTDVPFSACSARDALAARLRGDEQAVRDSGFAAFETELVGWLGTHRRQALTISLARHGQRLAVAGLDAARLTQRAHELADGDDRQRVTVFRQRIGEVASAGQDALAIAVATQDRLLAELDRRSERAAARIIETLRVRVARFQQTVLADARSTEREQKGRSFVIDMVREAVEGWRAEQTSWVAQALRDLDDRLASDLDARVASVRQAASELLGLQLTVPVERVRLAEDDRFAYYFSDDAGVTDLLAGSVRRHLPGPVARRRTDTWVLEQVDLLVDRQLGRVRSDLASRIDATGRRLRAEVSRRNEQMADGLLGALDAAVTIAASGQEVRARELAGLVARIAELERVAARLAESAAPAAGQLDAITARRRGTRRGSPGTRTAGRG
ncbi:MAG: dynamin family protein [Actinomycetes bacterium]